MLVQINTNAPFNYSAGEEVPRFNFYGDIVLVTDPGKTNMAMVVGTPSGTSLCILQFRAPGSAYDTSEYCHDFKAFISKYFKDCKVVQFGIEKAISKHGMNHHHSSMVLTEIRANLIDLAYELTGRKPFEINNWSWKYAILPDGMRSQSEKGSAKFLPDIYRVYGNADVTDAICMYRYILRQTGTTTVVTPNRSEKPLASIKVMIVPPKHPFTRDSRRFKYEPGLSLWDNATFFCNRTWERGVATVPVSSLSYEDIYEYAIGFPFDFSGDEVEVVVVRS